MNQEQARALLAQAQQHRQPTYEPSIFALGGRGYYENPTSDLLAFFLDPTQIHGFGDCFLRVLLSCIGQEPLPSTALRSPPEREVMTSNGNRIDLLLQGKEWILVLENKIFHGQVNPFADYELHAKALAYGSSSHPILVVLSPSGRSPDVNWIGLSYVLFINKLREELSCYSLLEPMDKWRVLVGEFVLHLENLTIEQAMDTDSVGFIFDHLPQINALNKLRDKALEALNSKILGNLQAEIPDYVPYTRRQNWVDGPVLRYACNDWENWSDVLLYLDCSQSTLKPFIRVYLCDADTNLMEQARKHFIRPSRQPWTEGKSVIGFEWQLETFDEQTIIEVITEKMKLLMRFENDDRRDEDKLASSTT
ncbi:hypothetical protein EKA85_31175 [Pseudomonas veronii]|uniref:PD-(D/E)XK nuclease family protein n=1 Tax=Pseudomonas TaxID=286 RepID=UPI000F849457|nr:MULTISPECIES: PD-(D/E)XK nuclease family protein [Pseudomonas]RTY59500.1 hypothetical protein EKA85_31175 [Pseudomonas veronii]WEX13722.1 PD-(D/E)XK nuclease family protein [Pseudomonas sp. G11]BBP58192.1 hypothetical protein PHLH4_17820 [Pseudomonas sp. St316]